MRQPQFIGCYRTTRKCYHCGWLGEFLVMDGEQLTKPSPSDYCLGVKHHQKIYDANDGQTIFGIEWRSRMEFDTISLLEGAARERFVAEK